MDDAFEWDLVKADANARKHGVTFEEAMSVFMDPLSMTVADNLHSDVEERFFTIGLSDRHRLLAVFHADRENRIRLISAREATARERKAYERTPGT